MNADTAVTGRDLLVDLVSTPSPSGDEATAADLLVEWFETHGREAWCDEVGNVRAPADDSVLLTSHIDTVPGDIPVRTTTEDGESVLWGRGSVDATGALAAMAVAAVETGVSFAGVVGEETDSRGARHLVESRTAPGALINGEPSGWDAYTLGYRGYLSGTYTVETPAAHDAGPETNAIEQAISWWNAVEAAVASEDSTTPAFQQTSATPLAIDGGPRTDGTTVTATVSLELRVPPETPAEAVREAVESETDSGSVEWDEPIPPVVASQRSSVATALRAAIRDAGGEPTPLLKTGTCDMNLYAPAWNCPMATYGPGDSTLDHAPDERLSLSSFDSSIGVLIAATEQLTEGVPA